MPSRRHLLLTACASLVLAGAASPPAQGRVGCAKPSGAGTRTVAFVDQGHSRPFLLSVPRGYDGHRRLPLILNLHGSGSNGAEQMAFSRLAPAAGAAGFAVAAPNGAVRRSRTGYAWNVPGVPLISGGPVPAGTPDDERYLLRVVARVTQVLCVDAQRIFLTGFSGGARMASQLACDHSARFAGIAPVGGLRAGVPQRRNGRWEPRAATCRPDRPVPVLAFHGTADDVNPYAGNGDPRWGYGIPAALGRWARLDGCGAPARSAPLTRTTTIVRYAGCRRGASVTLYRSAGAGHSWPGGLPSPFGPTDRTIDASVLIVRFFRGIGSRRLWGNSPPCSAEEYRSPAGNRRLA